MKVVNRIEIPLPDNQKTANFYIDTESDALELHVSGEKGEFTQAMIPKGKKMFLIIEVRE